jgi:hypothetical protein
MKRAGIILSFLILLSLLACKGDESTSGAEKEEVITMTGVVKYVNVEGGCWKIVGDDGNDFEPSNLPKAFMINDLPVDLEIMWQADFASVCQVGIPIVIVSISQQQP